MVLILNRMYKMPNGAGYNHSGELLNPNGGHHNHNEGGHFNHNEGGHHDHNEGLYNHNDNLHSLV